MDDRWTLQGKTALVTGGTKGIGRAIVEEFTAKGARVLFVARSKKDIERTEKELPEGSSLGISADISKKEGRHHLAARVKEETDKLDIMVQNAGTNIRGLIHEISYKDFETVLRTNFISAYDLSAVLFPLLKAAGDASMLLISSVAGIGHIPTGSAYGTSKAAMIQLAKNLAVEWGPHGIRVNVIAPWYTHTPLVEKVLEDKAYKARVLEQTPLGRIGEPGEIAALAAFLSMPAASFITGQCIAADGGMSVKLF
jgi:Tropinone reductase 1